MCRRTPRLEPPRPPRVHPLVDAQLSETLDHLAHEEDENPRLDADQHAVHKRELAEQAALLEGKLEQLVLAADGGEEGASARDMAGRYRMAKYELSRMHEAVAMSRLFSDEHRHLVFKNLHAMWPPPRAPARRPHAPPFGRIPWQVA